MGDHLEFLQQMKETCQIEDKMKYETKLKKFTGKMTVFFFLEEVLTDVQAWISKILNVGSGNSGKTKDEW